MTTHNPALDGIRGIAILMVIAFHCGFILPPFAVKLTGFGYVGVDLFFALSGYLITTTLLRDMERPGYPWRFYLRRTARILPAYFVYLLIVLAISPFTSGSDISGWAWYATFFQNYKPGLGVDDARASHLWSIAVEVQFYLVWPLVFYLAGKRRLPVACVLMAALATYARFTSSPGEAIHRMTLYRLDVLCIGSLMALIEIPTAVAIWVSVPCIAIGLFLCGTPLEQTYGYSAFAIGFALLVKWTAISSPQWLRAGWLRRCGEVSYTMYLIHLVAITACWFVLRRLPVGGLLLPVAVAITSFGIATLSWIFFENPLNQKAATALRSARPV